MHQISFQSPIAKLRKAFIVCVCVYIYIYIYRKGALIGFTWQTISSVVVSACASEGKCTNSSNYLNMPA